MFINQKIGKEAHGHSIWPLEPLRRHRRRRRHGALAAFYSLHILHACAALPLRTASAQKAQKKPVDFMLPDPKSGGDGGVWRKSQHLV